MSGTEQKQEVVLDTRPKPFVFVLMPFDKAFDDVYQLGIKTACEKAGAYAQRLDEQLFGESMLQRIYNQIAKADVVVADMTDRNPNVFYEVGYAHALGKVVILLTRRTDDIPFDLKHFWHIVYENVTGLLAELEKTVRWAVQKSREERQAGPSVAVYLHGDRLAINTIVTYTMDYKDILVIPLAYGTTNELRAVAFNVALWTSHKFTTCEWVEPGREPADESWDFGSKPKLPPENRVGAVYHPDGRAVFNRHKPITLLPGEWKQDCLYVAVNKQPLEERAEESMEVRISTESGSYSYPFIVKVLE